MAKCDICGAKVYCNECVDENPQDAICDVCGSFIPCDECIDDDEDGGMDYQTAMCGGKVSGSYLYA